MTTPSSPKSAGAGAGSKSQLTSSEYHQLQQWARTAAWNSVVLSTAADSYTFWQRLADMLSMISGVLLTSAVLSVVLGSDSFALKVTGSVLSLFKTVIEAVTAKLAFPKLAERCKQDAVRCREFEMALRNVLNRRERGQPADSVADEVMAKFAESQIQNTKMMAGVPWYVQRKAERLAAAADVSAEVRLGLGTVGFSGMKRRRGLPDTEAQTRLANVPLSEFQGGVPAFLSEQQQKRLKKEAEKLEAQVMKKQAQEKKEADKKAAKEAKEISALLKSHQEAAKRLRELKIPVSASSDEVLREVVAEAVTQAMTPRGNIPDEVLARERERALAEQRRQAAAAAPAQPPQ